MQLTSLNDDELAGYLATQTGKLLVQLRRKLIEQGTFGRELKNAGDALAHDYLITQLTQLRPNDAVLSEEALDDSTRLDSQRVWIIDPLDGTQEFSEPERRDWAVHVALWQKNNSSGDLIAGAVCLPDLNITLTADPPPPTIRKHMGNPRLVLSRTRTPIEAVIVAEALDCDVMRLGSAGAKAMTVVMGESDIYIHSGGQHQWDSAAPVAVARAAGLHTSRIDGSELIYNHSETWLPDLIICQPELAEPVLAALRNAKQ